MAHTLARCEAGGSSIEKERTPMLIRRFPLIACVLVATLPLFARAACTADEPQPLTAAVNGWGTAEILNSPPKFYKDGTRVHLLGIVWKFTGSNSAQYSPLAFNEAVVVMPPGYRPAQVETFTVAANSVEATWITVYPGGEVYVHGTFNYFAWVSLSGVSFRAQ